jgi:hypothetical protein
MRRAWHAAAAYLALTIVATWPLAEAWGATYPRISATRSS